MLLWPEFHIIFMKTLKVLDPEFSSETLRSYGPNHLLKLSGQSLRFSAQISKFYGNLLGPNP